MITTRPEGNIIDSRDLIGWQAYCLLDEGSDDWDEDERADAKAIEELADSGIEDWQYGATLIHEDHFEDYAQELAEDLGSVDKDAGWPMQHIDWAAAAEALKADYTEVEWNGETYLVRA